MCFGHYSITPCDYTVQALASIQQAGRICSSLQEFLAGSLETDRKEEGEGRQEEIRNKRRKEGKEMEGGRKGGEGGREKRREVGEDRTVKVAVSLPVFALWIPDVCLREALFGPNLGHLDQLERRGKEQKNLGTISCTFFWLKWRAQHIAMRERPSQTQTH